MENMSYEILEAIKYSYENDNTLVKDCLFYMYNTTNDTNMKRKIEKWFEKNEYCINCGEKLRSYEWAEIHDELEGSPNEYFNCLVCPNCNNAKFESEKEF